MRVTSQHRTPGDAQTPPLDRDDIQGNILRPYRCAATTYLFLTVTDRASARQWLGELADQITPASAEDLPVAVNLAVTCAGLARLGVAPERLARFPEAFRQGMACRAERLGDPVVHRDGTAAPEGWHPPFGMDNDVHLMLMVSGSVAAVAAKVDELEQGFWQAGVTEPDPALTAGRTGDGVLPLDRRLVANRLEGGVEHFGFRDGLSQPAVEGVHPSAIAGTGRLVVRRTRGVEQRSWVPITAGEFILGLPAEDGTVLDDVPSLTRNGSYLVLRKLEQDVPAFEAMVARVAEQAGLDPELARAKIMGRWRDGTPLVHAPGRRDGGLSPGPAVTPDAGFDYDHDPDGVRCPVGAHVRRANPRGSLGFDGRLEHRRRIIRRGMPYGPPHQDGTEDVERGLVFVCYQADIAGQFELVQSQWLADGNVFALGADRDPVVADVREGSGLMRLEGTAAAQDAGDRPPVFVSTDAPCVRLRGGEYFLVPSRSAIRRLARLPDLPAPRAAQGSR